MVLNKNKAKSPELFIQAIRKLMIGFFLVLNKEMKFSEIKRSLSRY